MSPEYAGLLAILLVPSNPAQNVNLEGETGNVTLVEIVLPCACTALMSVGEVI
jgi:hypothetical protein